MENKMIISLGLLITIPTFVFFQNNSIQKTFIKYESKMIPDSFDNYRITHISDFHNKAFGTNQRNLLKKIESENPNIIVITGDLIDRRKYDLDKALTFVEGAVKITPVYYVSGNHEAWSGQYKAIRDELMNLGVHVLDDQKTEITKNNESIEIIGVKDPGFYTSNYLGSSKTESMESYLNSVSNSNKFQILLSHRPELFDVYSDNNIDLIFSGHAHGGQFRLPFIGGLIAPNQGFFPDYTEGSHKQENSTLIISRGLGNSIIPLRLFNRPEIITVQLNKISKR